MRAVIQRAKNASVSVADKIIGEIDNGVVILLGIEETDTQEDIDWLVRKISNMRIFDDDNGVMNLSLLEADGNALVISQFTLQASTKKGNRPSYIKAARPEQAEPMYQTFSTQLATIINKPAQTGKFGTDMQVSLINDGPVTILLDTKNKE